MNKSDGFFLSVPKSPSFASMCSLHGKFIASTKLMMNKSVGIVNDLDSKKKSN